MGITPGDADPPVRQQLLWTPQTQTQTQTPQLPRGHREEAAWVVVKQEPEAGGTKRSRVDIQVEALAPARRSRKESRSDDSPARAKSKSDEAPARAESTADRVPVRAESKRDDPQEQAKGSRSDEVRAEDTNDDPAARAESRDDGASARMSSGRATEASSDVYHRKRSRKEIAMYECRAQQEIGTQANRNVPTERGAPAPSLLQFTRVNEEPLVANTRAPTLANAWVAKSVVLLGAEPREQHRPCRSLKQKSAKASLPVRRSRRLQQQQCDEAPSPPRLQQGLVGPRKRAAAARCRLPNVFGWPRGRVRACVESDGWQYRTTYDRLGNARYPRKAR